MFGPVLCGRSHDADLNGRPIVTRLAGWLPRRQPGQPPYVRAVDPDDVRVPRWLLRACGRNPAVFHREEAALFESTGLAPAEVLTYRTLLRLPSVSVGDLAGRLSMSI